MLSVHLGGKVSRLIAWRSFVLLKLLKNAVFLTYG